MSTEIVKKKKYRRAKRTAETTFDRIYQYYFINKKNVRVDLNDEEEEIRQRWEFAWNMLCGIHSKMEIVRAIVERFDCDRSTAFRYIDSACRLFGNPSDQVKKARREVVNSWLETAIRKAEEKEDYDAMSRLILRYTKINGLDKEKENMEEEMVRNFKPHTIVITGAKKELLKEADDLMRDVPETQDAVFEIMDDDEDS